MDGNIYLLPSSLLLKNLPAVANENLNKILKESHPMSTSVPDYGPAAVTPNTTNQQELQKLCSEYLRVTTSNITTGC